MPDTLGLNAPTAPAAPATTTPTVPGPTPGVGGNTAATNTSSFTQDAAGNITASGAPSDSSGTIGSAFSSLMKFADAHPVAALGALQAGGSLLSGSFSTLTPAQVNALNAQAAANDAAAALTRQQTANLAMPKAVASSAPVTGTAQLVPIAARPAAAPTQTAAVTPTGPAGFINQAPVSSQPVTGVAA